MTHDAQKYEKIFSGTKEVAENLKIDASKLQPWIDAHVPGAGSIKSIEQFKGGQSNHSIRLFISTILSVSDARYCLDHLETCLAT